MNSPQPQDPIYDLFKDLLAVSNNKLDKEEFERFLDKKFEVLSENVVQLRIQAAKRGAIAGVVGSVFTTLLIKYLPTLLQGAP